MADLNYLAQDWPHLSRRLDEALAVADDQRDTWLAGLNDSEAIKATLRQLLGDARLMETADFAQSLPQLTLGPAELGAAEAEADSAADVASVGTQVGPYHLIRELGQGGMGQVWLAERVDGSLQRQVALKLPRLGWATGRTGLAERLRRERDILAGLAHPNIARLYDAGVDAQGRPYLALEYVEGEAIDLHCQHQALTIQQRLQLILQVARAVAHAHARLVVHRDLKPANILVTPEGQVRLLDFGIAKLLEGELTRETQLTQLGGRALTLDYASPEQIRGEPIGTASDVYSLGVVAYELLARARPYQLKRDSAAALEEAIASVDVRLASAGASDRVDSKALKGDLDAILSQALKKNVAERYATVEALALDIERHLGGLPVLARPDSAAYRLRKFAGRNRLAIGAATLVALSMVSGAGLATWKAVEARDERVRAERVKDMIGAIFASATPYATGAKELSVRDLLQAGVARIERELKNEPAIAAELLSLISSSYRDLGDVDESLKTAQAAQERASAGYAAGHPMRARVLRVLAQAHLRKGGAKQAQALLEQAIAMQRQRGDEAAHELAESLGSLASALNRQGRLEDAVNADREAVALLLRVRGEKDELTISALGELAGMLMVGGHAEESLAYAQRAHRLALSAYPDPAHPAVIDQMAHLAYALRANGQNVVARDMWQQVVAAQRRIFNPRGAQVAASSLALGQSQALIGELKEGLSSLEESLAMMQGYGAKVDGELAIRYYGIGLVALQARQPEKALRALGTAIDMGTTAYGAGSPRVRDAQNFRAAALIYAGRLAEAQTLIDAQVEGDRRSQNPMLSAALRNSALLDRAIGELQAPLAKLREARAIEATRKGITAKALAVSLSELGRAQLDAQQADAAIATLAQAIVELRAEEPTPTPQQADAWVALGRALLVQGQANDAQPLLKAAITFWDQFAPDSAFAGEAGYWYGRYERVVALRAQPEPASAPAPANQRFVAASALLASSSWPAHRQQAQRER